MTIEKEDMTPPNTTPSSLSPLEMATLAPTHSPAHTHTHKSTTQGGRGENARVVGFRWTFLQLPSYGQQSLSISLFQKKKDHINSSKNILVFQRTGEKLRREV